MKLGTPFFILLIIAFAVVSINLIVGDISTSYPEANVSISGLDRYNYINNVNSSFYDISEAANKASDAEGWWDKLISGGTVIFLAVISVVTSLINSIPLFGGILSLAGDKLGVPSAITSIGFVAIIGAIVIMIVKFVHRGSE
jgi:hypothetical protein